MNKKFNIDKDDGTCLECNILLADICGICHNKLIEQKRKELIEEFEKILLQHKNCNEYHKSFTKDKKDYFLISCIAQILIDLNKLKEKKE